MSTRGRRSAGETDTPTDEPAPDNGGDDPDKIAADTRVRPSGLTTTYPDPKHAPPSAPDATNAPSTVVGAVGADKGERLSDNHKFDQWTSDPDSALESARIAAERDLAPEDMTGRGGRADTEEEAAADAESQKAIAEGYQQSVQARLADLVK